MTDAQKTYRILLVDDDQFLLDMYALKFNQQGHTVQSCFSVEEALEALRKGFEPDAIVFDLVMPQKDGFDFLRVIREEKLAPNATLIALTNQNVQEESKKAQELGAHEYIVKATVVPSEVVPLVTTALEKH
jgi:CheY-like chemotaxis protein